MSTRVIPTPEWDEQLYNNASKSNEPRSARQLHAEAKRQAENQVEAALDKATEYDLSILSGRFDLSQFRSDEVEVFMTLLEKIVTRSIKVAGGFKAPVFILYEKKTPTYVVNDVRDLTFMATRRS